MARIDTLANFLTDVAAAIKDRTGKTDPITPANFDTEIASIESGGDNIKFKPRAISFYGYLGTELNYEVDNVDTSEVTSMYQVFRECANLISLDLSSWDTSKVTAMNHMFCMAKALTSLNVSNWDTSNVTAMNWMFYGIQVEELDLSSFNTLNVINMEYMFNMCSKLQRLDIRNFDFTNVAQAGYMWDGIPSDCLIIVKDSTAKDWILNKKNTLTNIKTVAELEAS